MAVLSRAAVYRYVGGGGWGIPRVGRGVLPSGAISIARAQPMLFQGPDTGSRLKIQGPGSRYRVQASDVQASDVQASDVHASDVRCSCLRCQMFMPQSALLASGVRY